MQNNKIQYIICICLFISLLLFDSCARVEDQEFPEPFQPCKDVQPTSADFGIYRTIVGRDSVYYLPMNDTVYNKNNLAGSPITFKAHNSKMTKYEWQVGTDTRTFTDSEFTLNFSGQVGTVPVTLRVENDNAGECHDAEPSTMVITKEFPFALVYWNAFEEETPIMGTYVGYNESDPTDNFNIEIGLLERVINFPRNLNQSDCTASAPIARWYRNFAFDYYDGVNCYNIAGTGQLQLDNKTLIIDYERDEFVGSEARYKDRFIGTKVE